MLFATHRLADEFNSNVEFEFIDKIKVEYPVLI